jgi:hypothetical protein
MLQYVFVGAALSLGQVGSPPPPAPVLPMRFQQPPEQPPAEPPLEEEKPVIETEEEAATAAPPADRWLLMRALQGTWPGYLLDGHGTQLYGWVETSVNGSSRPDFNTPVVWNYLANALMMQQAWLRFERTVKTDAAGPTWGFRSDWLYGTDYIFTLPRGIFNGQLTDATGGLPDRYGVDPISFYGEVYFPTVARGLDLRLGRWFTPFGVESLEAISTPTVTRSYSFNFAPPFTHTGLLSTWNLTPSWTMQAGICTGNDVFIDPAAEARYVGTLRWAPPGGRNTVTLGTSVGRGSFDAEEAFNRINVFDLVYTHAFTPNMSYALETIYGYQDDTPLPDGTVNFANWLGVANYLFYTFGPRATAVGRLEFFDDFQGARTGSEGLYTAITGGMAFKPAKGLWVRPELRYDYNDHSRPFQGKHGIFVASCDCILRW